MSGPIGANVGAPTSAATPGSNQSGPPERGNGRVVAAGPAGTVVRFQGRPWLLDGALRLPRGAAVQLELGPPGVDGVRAGRLLAAAGQRLEPPLPVRATPTNPGPTKPGPTDPRQAGPGGVEVLARPVGADGRARGPSFPVRLSVLAGDLEPRPAIAEHGSAARGAGDGADRGHAPGRSSATTISRPPPGGPNPPPPARLPAGGSPAPNPSPAGSPASVSDATAEVIRHGPRGSTLLQTGGLQTGGRMLEVATPLSLPIGARLTLRLPTGAGWPVAEGSSDIGASARDAGEEVARAIAPQPTTSPGAANGPPPDRGLAAQLLRLMASLPDREADAAPERAARSAAGPSRAPDAPASGWRLLVLPWALPGSADLRLYLRDDQETGPDPDEPRDRQSGSDRRRAVFEVGFSELGRCQLDAYCQGRRFDLVIRTEHPLPPGLRAEVRALFEAARELAGLTGELGFQAPGLRPLTEPRGSGRRITV